MKLPYIIGTADDDFVEKCLDRWTTGAGYKGKWFVDIRRCVKLAYTFLMVGKPLSELIKAYIEKEIQHSNLEYEEIVHTDLHSDEILRAIIKSINRTVIEEVVHAYGNVGHPFVYRIRYGNGAERDFICSILERHNVKQQFDVVHKIIKGLDGKIQGGEFELEARVLDIDMYEKYLEMLKAIEKSLSKKGIKGVAYSRHYGIGHGSKNFDSLIAELGEFGLFEV
jgi:hypothetical protein